MIFNKGDHVEHETSGLRGKVVSRGHYPDTCFIEIEPAKDGELPRKTEVYIRQLRLVRETAL